MNNKQTNRKNKQAGKEQLDRCRWNDKRQKVDTERQLDRLTGV